MNASIGKQMDWTAQLENDFFDESKAEHITLSSEPGETATQNETPPTTNRFFLQSDKSGTTRNFTIFDQQFLAVSVEPLRAARQQYTLDLAFLDPEPHRFAGIAWRWLWAALGLAITAVFMLVFGRSAPIAILELPVMPALLLAATAIFTGAFCIHRSSLVLTFYSLHGRAPLLTVDPRLPDPSAVARFVQELQERIRAARERKGSDRQQFLREELRAHNRLFETGILPESGYEASKTRILAQHG